MPLTESIPDDEDDALAEALADSWIAEITSPGADVGHAAAIYNALHQIDENLPVTVRMDSVIALANALGVQLPTSVLADMSGCTRAAFYERTTSALESFRVRADEAGLSHLYTSIDLS